MQREVVRILKKHLHKGYDDHQFEFSIISPHLVMAEDWDRLSEPPTEEKIRGCARELISTIRGIKDADLYVIPERDRVVRLLRDIAPLDEREQIEWAEGHADFVLEQLTILSQSIMWRGKRIDEVDNA